MNVEIAEALWNAANRHGHAGLELEFRLGHVLAGGQFSSNVGRDQFLKLKKKLDDSTVFDTYCVETVEKIASSVKHVTTLNITGQSGENPPPPSFCMTKNKVFHKDFVLDPASPYTVRCGIAIEKIIPMHQINSKFTRHKKRVRYVYRSWAFDLTEVVSNTDLDTEESFEVEIELMDSGLLFERTMDSVAEWGLKLVTDCIRMLELNS